MTLSNAKYTVLLKTIMENPDTKPLLEQALSKYPLYKQKVIPENDISYIPTREQLNQKILNHYKYREIGFETVGRFLDELSITMDEIMPYYNQMLETVETMNTIDDIFGNVDVIETFEEERKDITNSEGSANSLQTSGTKQSTESNANSEFNQNDLKTRHDTPQGTVDDIDRYLTEANKETLHNENTGTEKAVSEGSANSTSQSSSSGAVDSSGTVKHTMTKKGNQGVNTYAHDMIEFRTSILNIEKMIINDERLKELFFLVY